MLVYLIAALVELILFAVFLLVWTAWLVTTSESNCLFFALTRFKERGGYLIMRKSHHGWFPHFLWSEDLETFEQYVPYFPSEHLKFPPLWFAGFIRTGQDRKATTAAHPDT